MDGNGQLVVALVGVSLLILAARGSLATAWSTLLGNAGSSSSSGPSSPSLGGNYACQLPRGVGCVPDATACKALGGIPPPLARDAHVCSASNPGPGAPGSGVTTQ